MRLKHQQLKSIYRSKPEKYYLYIRFEISGTMETPKQQPAQV